MNRKVNYSFDVEVIEEGQRQSYGDSFYTYKVSSLEPEYRVKEFCKGVLKMSYPKNEMPDPFAGELLEFKKITSNGKDSFSSMETYSYKVRTEYTG